MKNKLFMTLMGLSASVLTFFALSTSASACFYGSYQPEEPTLLREE